MEAKENNYYFSSGQLIWSIAQISFWLCLQYHIEFSQTKYVTRRNTRVIKVTK